MSEFGEKQAAISTREAQEFVRTCYAAQWLGDEHERAWRRPFSPIDDEVLMNDMETREKGLMRAVDHVFESPAWHNCATPEAQGAFISDVTTLATASAVKNHTLWDETTTISVLLKEPSRIHEPFIDNAALPSEERIVLLNIYGQNPALAESFIRNKIWGIHATTSASLLSVLEQGLLPFNKLVEKGIPIFSGAHDASSSVKDGVSCATLYNHSLSSITRYFYGQVTEEELSNAIEFGRKAMTQPEGYGGLIKILRAALPHLEARRDYHATTPTTLEEKLKLSLVKDCFGIAYAVKQHAVWDDSSRFFDDGLSIGKKRNSINDKTFIPQGLSGEVVVRGGIALEDIGLILVPEIHIEFMRALLKQRGVDIEVGKMDDIPAFAEAMRRNSNRPNPLMNFLRMFMDTE